MRRPYVMDNNDAMQMIRHNNEFSQFHCAEMVRYRRPTFLHDFPQATQPHFAIRNLSEKTFMSPHADRHKIRPDSGIIEIAESS